MSIRRLGDSAASLILQYVYGNHYIRSKFGTTVGTRIETGTDNETGTETGTGTGTGKGTGIGTEKRKREK
jgi:hypothetical protein